MAHISQHAVADIARAQVTHVHERHAAGEEAEQEYITRKSIFGVIRREVEVDNPFEVRTRQRPFAGRGLPDGQLSEGVDVGSGNKPFPDGPVVDGPEVAQVENHGVRGDAARPEPALVALDPANGELSRRQTHPVQVTQQQPERCPVICCRPFFPCLFVIEDVLRETQHEVELLVTTGTIHPGRVCPDNRMPPRKSGIWGIHN